MDGLRHKKRVIFSEGLFPKENKSRVPSARDAQMLAWLPSQILFMVAEDTSTMFSGIWGKASMLSNSLQKVIKVYFEQLMYLLLSKPQHKLEKTLSVPQCSFTSRGLGGKVSSLICAAVC